jgi:hypothetical protein
VPVQDVELSLDDVEALSDGEDLALFEVFTLSGFCVTWALVFDLFA